jgi:NADPH:quinone reductase-like Zn-dependent oxidoreductase
VLGVHVDGGDAERCIVPARSLVGIPEGVGFDQAASMGVSFPLAWNLLGIPSVGPGDQVLVMAAGGALGIAGTLIAKFLGARVIAASSSIWKLDRCRELLGADSTVDYTAPDWADQVRAQTRDGAGVSVVYENISSPELFPAALSTLRSGGWLVTSGAHGGGTVPLDVRHLYRSHLRIAGETAASMATAATVFGHVASGGLPAPPVFHRYRLADIAAAHAAASGRDLFGRVVLVTPAGETTIPLTGMAYSGSGSP